MDLRRPGSILLVSCYELGRQPLSIASPVALLREAGYFPAALDLAVERFDPEAVSRALLVAIAVPMHTALRLGARAVERVRAINPGAHICLYGLYASLNAETLLARGADSAIGGEYEEPLLRLAGALEAAFGAGAPRDRPGPADLPFVPGLRTRDHIGGPWVRKIRFAVPRRDLLQPLDRYARLEANGSIHVAAHVEASRGCLHRCRHCPIPPVYEGRFFIVPREIVLADIRQQVAAGAAHVTFGDPDFLNGPGHAMALVRKMHAEFPDLTFDFTSKIEHLLNHRRLLSELARLGCLFIVSAVESLSDRVLAILDKGHTRAGVGEALALTRGAGIALRPSFVPFTPWTTLRDYLDLLDFIDGEDLIDHLDPVQLSIRLLVPPGSLLLDHPEMRPFLGPLDPDRFTCRWIHPDPEMDRLQLDVSAIVERAARDREDPLVTFRTIRARAAAGAARPGLDPRPALGTSRLLGVSPARGAPPARRDKSRPPRLTEPWFC